MIDVLANKPPWEWAAMAPGSGATIGIIGAGQLCRALTPHLVKANCEVIICNSRGPQTLVPVTAELGPRVRAGTIEQVADPEIVFLAVPWSSIPVAVSNVLNWEHRIVIDATNATPWNGSPPPDLGGRTSSEIVADFVPEALLVKAFNTLPAATLAADPHQHGGQRIIFFSSNHASAKREVARLITHMGFAGIDLGTLAEGGRLHEAPAGPLASLNCLKVGAT